MANDNLEFLRIKLKNGEYDGVDIMDACIAIDELINFKKKWRPPECAVEIGVSDDLQYAMCDSDPYLLDTAEKVEWANKVSAPMIEWVLGDHCYYKPGKVEFK